ncbi:ovostatin-like [Bombina bombina]|uniref:ovostatin-like n=1 Tax=Bombina bombina TaxID=8345 RepID=UPI00235B15A5|nr:ovostatin-like [Bombina bombina]
MIKSGQTEKVCVNLVGQEEALFLNVVLQHNGVNTTIFDENVPVNQYYKCNDFTVPSVEQSVPVFVLLSAKGNNSNILERKSVVIDSLENIYKIQMDKPIYRPGHKVRFRLISLNSQLQPIKTMYPVTYLKDPSGSRVAQWLNQESDRGILSFEFQLIRDALPGSYSITAEKQSGNPLYQYFTVEEYVLPRYSINVASPRTLSVLAETLIFNVTATYTYGQPVPGLVTGSWCRKPSYYYGRRRNCNKNKDGICDDIKGKLGPDGTYNGILDLASFHMQLSGFEMSLTLDITVTEEGTGVQVTESRYVQITSQLAKIRFESMNPNYKRGIPYVVMIKLMDESDRPMPNKEIELEIEGETNQKVTTDEAGKAEYAIDTSSFVRTNFTLKASYQDPDQCYYTSWREYPDYPTAEYTIQRFYSQSGSFVQVLPPKGEMRCGQNYNIDVQYILTMAGVGKGAEKATFYFLVMSRAEIVHYGQQEVDFKESVSSSFSFDLPITASFAPSADFVVYSILQKEIIVDTVRLSIEKCFKNEVSLSFSEEQGAPASSVDLLFTGAADSLCAFRVIDYSLMLLNPYESFSAESVYNSMRYRSLYGYYVNRFNVEDTEPPCDDPDKQIFYNGNYYVPVSSEREGDSYQKVKKLGLVFGTQARLRKPMVCKKETQQHVYPLIMESSSLRGFSPAAKPMMKNAGLLADVSDMEAPMSAATEQTGSIETVRKNFADNWVWEIASVGSDGRGTIPLVVPDTITQWKGSMFCVSEKEGFGMTRSPANFTSFQPFFAEMSLPYSIVRGETLVLKAFVPNYLEYCIKIEVTLKRSPGFAAKLQEGKQDVCICSGERASYTWNVVFKKLGEISLTLSAETTHIGETCDGPSDPSQPSRKDTMIQTLLVEAEGIRKEETKSNLICIKDKNYETPISLTTSNNVVPDSEEAFVTCLGDPLGLPLQNLQNLIQLPYGCGEHNLARMAPIIHVLEYLNATGQLTPEILEKGKRFLTEGYFRQLRYRMYGGPYGTFGRTETSGNSWLTAYTFKTFEKAKKFIYIDSDIQKQTLIWLQRSQKLESGCFKSSGNLFMMQGDVDDSVSFTAYLSIALLESNYSLSMGLLEGTMTCLVAASKVKQSMYNQALMVYAFTLARNWERRDYLLKQLKQVAIIKGGTMHWERERKNEKINIPFLPHPNSPADVEITSYILLSIAKGPNITKDDSNTMAQIAVWVIQQQNSNGGFRSTQDTVVALQALSASAQVIYTPNAHHNVIVTRRNRAVKKGNTKVAQCSMNQENRLLVQRQSLTKVPGDYTFFVSGTGCCLIQTTVKYNVPVSQEKSAFSLSVTSSSESCVNGVAYTFTIGINISYRGSRQKPNMVIIDIKMLSGYTADYWSLREMTKSKLVSKSEEQNGHVFLYLNSLSRESVNLSLKVQMGTRVLNVKEASVSAYDYYELDENALARYRHPCAAQN